MSLSAGTRLGPYEILGPLGAGGMGEVFRARDSRLSREVAIKVLPAQVASDSGRLKRFEKEARSASALNHPNIVTIHDIGSAGGIHWISMEKVEGRTLREVLFAGPLPVRKLLPIAAQIACGLARAHEAGIVHRDLKPENVMVTKDGLVKILDFGLAKLTASGSGGNEGSQLPTETGTSSGVVMGTVGYMSPEQASGLPLDSRSDQFSFGSILYEMASGKRAFQKATGVDTLSAILHEDPQPIGEINPQAPAPLRWIVERCLAKEPGQRYDSTGDLARDLSSLREHVLESLSPDVTSGRPAARRVSSPALLAAALVSLIALALGLLLSRRTNSPEPPIFHRLTWRRGTVESARFAPDGQTVLYSASWEGNPTATYMKRPESPDAVALDLPSALLLAISPKGQMAIQLDRRDSHFGFTGGTLALVALTGGTPRESAENVNQVDWGPGGSLVAARDVGQKGRLEYPLGRVLYETNGHVSFPRLSPRGDLVAFVDHPLPTADDRGSIAVVDLQGKKRTLSAEFESVQGLAWSPSGDEVWFTAAAAGGVRPLWAVTLEGKQRAIARMPGDVRLQDVTRSGRVLLTQGDNRFGIRWLVPGESRERELSGFGMPFLADLSSDGKSVVFFEQGEPAGPNYAVCLIRSDSQPVRLGEGYAGPISPDGKWVVSRLPKAGSPIVFLPTGPGEPREIRQSLEIDLWVGSAWLPDSKRLVLMRQEAGHGLYRLFVVGLDRDEPRPMSPQGVRGPIAVSPDGRFAAARGSDRKIELYPVDGGEPRAVPGALEGDVPLRWSRDGRALHVLQQRRRTSDPGRLFRLDLDTGKRVLWKELFPDDPAGIVNVIRPCVTPDGRSYAYTYYRSLSALYLVEGLR